jgi:GTP-binding protein Era
VTDATAHRTGVVAILGPANAGKSTLLNALLGEKLAIVTPRPQTTRSRILGVLTRPGAQILLHDTPGLHRPSRALGQAMNELVDEARQDCDLALVLVDLTRGWRAPHAELQEALEKSGTPFLLVGTQSDRHGADTKPWPPPEARGAEASLRVSARTGDGLGELLDQIVERLPEGPALYPEDEISDRSLRFLAAELVREAAIGELAQELPYRLAVEVEEFAEDPDCTRIRANLLVERASQKQIVIGRGGAVIKRIGVAARREIERLVGGKVHLALWVKVEPRWTRRPKRLKSLGYS